MPSPPLSVAIVGAGAAGLAAAHRLRARGAAVVVFESSARPGGVVRTESSDGYTVDLGPNTMADTPAVSTLVAELGIEEKRTFADARAPRYVVRAGRLVPVPLSPPALLKSPLLSVRGKIRLLAEPFVRRHTDPADESLADFVRRRFGEELLDRAVSAFVAGVWAGDPARLSARHAFPRLVALEHDHGSVLRGMARVGRAAKAAGVARPRSFSFLGGMQTLTDALATSLGTALRLRTPVRALHREGDGWRVVTDAHPDGERFDHVVLAVPLHALAPLLPALPPADGATLAAVVHPPVSVLALGFRRAQVAHALDGFGVLVPEREPFSILGALFSSALFPGRAPDGHVLVTVFVGGTRRSELAGLPTDALLKTVLGDLGRLLGVRGAPSFVRHELWPRAIPQYDVGYGRVLDVLDRIEAEHPRLALAGSFRGGIALGDALASGLAAADRLLAPTGPASTSP